MSAPAQLSPSKPRASDPPAGLNFLQGELDAIRAQGRYRTLRIVEGTGPRARVDGREVIHLCSNGYLGLNSDPQILGAAHVALHEYGAGSGSSRLIAGTTREHQTLERELAALKGTQDAVVYGTGYQASLGVVAALFGPGDLILSDALNHASLIDACRLSRADVQVFRHGDAAHAGQLLREHRKNHRRALVLTDGVFSMDGDLAPLTDLCNQAQENDALVMVDDAHGTGVLGETGSGTAELLGVRDRVDIHMGTLSKALASQGGFIAGSALLCDYLRNVSRPFIFSTAPPAADMAVARAAIECVRTEPWRRERLRENAAVLSDGLQALGLRVQAGLTPILPILVGEEAAAMRLMECLLEEGVYAAAIRPPTVAPGSCRIRVTVTATHSRADLEQALQAFSVAARRAGVIA